MTRMPGTPRPTFDRSLLSPRQWPAWIGIGIIWLIARLPYRALMQLGHLLGSVVQRVRSPRRKVAATNVALCFPELSDAEQKALVDANLHDIGLMMMEFALGWMGSDQALKPP